MRLRTSLTAKYASRHIDHAKQRHAAAPNVKKRTVKRTQSAVVQSSERLTERQLYGRYHHDQRVPEPAAEARPPPLALNDLECIRTLGAGSYGSVVLVHVRPKEEHALYRSGNLFALKVLKKADLRYQDKGYPQDTDAEIQSLCYLPWSPWVSGAIGVFHDSLNLYLMLEYMPAGVLHDIIQRRGPLDASTARFYYANIVCALRFLHHNGIAHRDLKPANILIKSDGYIALADFGLAKNVSYIRTLDWLLVGTSTYTAPELIHLSEKDLGIGVDWFSSGIVLYEMVTKRVPFDGIDGHTVYARIASGKYKWARDIRVGKSLKSIVAGLLTCEAPRRLGVRKAVEKHAWLSGINWKRMNNQGYFAPWVPGDVHVHETLHEKSLPSQESIPGLKVVEPPEYLRHDHQLSRKKQPATPDEASVDGIAAAVPVADGGRMTEPICGAPSGIVIK